MPRRPPPTIAHAPEGNESHDYRGHERGPAPIAQWVGLLLAPLVFTVHLQTAYVLVQWACRRAAGMLPVHVAGAIAVALAAVGLWAAWIAWTRAGAEGPGDEGGPVARTRLLAATGLGMSGLLVLLLAAQLAAGFVVPACQ